MITLKTVFNEMARIIVLPEELQLVVDRLTEIEKVIKKEKKQIEDPILSTEDVLNLLKVSRRSLQSWRDNGIIAFSAVGGKFYYRMSSIDSMLSKNLKREYDGRAN